MTLSAKKKYQQHGYMPFKAGIVYAISHYNLTHTHILLLKAASWSPRAFGENRFYYIQSYQYTKYPLLYILKLLSI